MAYYQQTGPTMAMPLPQDFQAPFMSQQTFHQHLPNQRSYAQSPYSYYQSPIPQQPVQQPQRYPHQRHNQQFPAYKPYAQHQQHFQRSHQFNSPPDATTASTVAPPLPAKEPLNVQTSWQASNQTDEEVPPTLPPRPAAPAIAPDPLPPHSNPQKLSPTQSAAFEGPAPIPSMKLGRDSISDANGSAAIFTIVRDAVHVPSFLSTKPLLTITRTATLTPVGTIRFHTMDNSTCDISLTGGSQTRLKEDGWIHFRWALKPNTPSTDGQTWYFKKSKPDIVLEDAKKHGNVIARLSGDSLRFEKGGLGQAELDVVVLGFVALAEAARRSGKVGELAESIGDLPSSVDVSGGGGIS
ncbi:hypothetical protein K431DRAFT_281994 [Polychaeton citri CBS 116435]|uniref:Uncharacterized protein n=1 Tax=Polychaeton citri CBS 116435 TaxID=1314669 RepID=A0A9P4QGN6_9PEZI|nr:hypothetical protein K431DRAFT_281994 [Polychaeton citri CBS 116435]